MNVTLDFGVLARLAKIVALFGFMLPWVVVSCSDTVMVSGTGVELMTGSLQTNPQWSEAARNVGGDQSSTGVAADGDPNVYAIAAFAIAAFGLLLGAFLRRKAAAWIFFATALASAGAAYYSIESVRVAMRKAMDRPAAGSAASDETAIADKVGAAAARMIKVEPQAGYWLTLSALLAAGLSSGLALATRRAPEGGPETQSTLS